MNTTRKGFLASLAGAICAPLLPKIKVVANPPTFVMSTNPACVWAGIDPAFAKGGSESVLSIFRVLENGSVRLEKRVYEKDISSLIEGSDFLQIRTINGATTQLT